MRFFRFFPYGRFFFVLFFSVLWLAAVASGRALNNSNVKKKRKGVFLSEHLSAPGCWAVKNVRLLETVVLCAAVWAHRDLSIRAPVE